MRTALCFQLLMERDYDRLIHLKRSVIVLLEEGSCDGDSIEGDYGE